MRTQYHFRRSPNGLHAWNVHQLVERTRTLLRERVEPHWSNENARQMTCRELVGHSRLILDCDLGYPVILSSDGRVMDGMHRICKALLLGLNDIDAVRFIQDPEPDYVGVHPDDLPY